MRFSILPQSKAIYNIQVNIDSNYFAKSLIQCSALSNMLYVLWISSHHTLSLESLGVLLPTKQRKWDIDVKRDRRRHCLWSEFKQKFTTLFVFIVHTNKDKVDCKLNIS